LYAEHKKEEGGGRLGGIVKIHLAMNKGRRERGHYPPKKKGGKRRKVGGGKKRVTSRALHDQKKGAKKKAQPARQGNGRETKVSSGDMNFC